METDRRRVLIFTGAGMGAALGLPTTTGFVEAVRNNAEPITNEVMGYLSTESEDIEWILATLETFREKQSLAEHVLPRFAKGNGHAEVALSHFQNNFKEYRRQAHRELARIKRLIFEKLGGFNLPDAARLYRSLFVE